MSEYAHAHRRDRAHTLAAHPHPPARRMHSHLFDPFTDAGSPAGRPRHFIEKPQRWPPRVPAEQQLDQHQFYQKQKHQHQQDSPDAPGIRRGSDSTDSTLVASDPSAQYAKLPKYPSNALGLGHAPRHSGMVRSSSLRLYTPSQASRRDASLYAPSTVSQLKAHPPRSLHRSTSHPDMATVAGAVRPQAAPSPPPSSARHHTRRSVSDSVAGGSRNQCTACGHPAHSPMDPAHAAENARLAARIADLEGACIDLASERADLSRMCGELEDALVELDAEAELGRQVLGYPGTLMPTAGEGGGTTDTRAVRGPIAWEDEECADGEAWERQWRAERTERTDQWGSDGASVGVVARDAAGGMAATDAVAAVPEPECGRCAARKHELEAALGEEKERTAALCALVRREREKHRDTLAQLQRAPPRAPRAPQAGYAVHAGHTHRVGPASCAPRSADSHLSGDFRSALRQARRALGGLMLAGLGPDGMHPLDEASEEEDAEKGCLPPDDASDLW